VQKLGWASSGDNEQVTVLDVKFASYFVGLNSMTTTRLKSISDFDMTQRDQHNKGKLMPGLILAYPNKLRLDRYIRFPGNNCMCTAQIFYVAFNDDNDYLL
jgi:hypothetical protein